MLPKHLRLPYPLSRIVRSRGQRCSSSELELFFLPSTNSSSRWLIQVPKKVVPPATRRNRIKRLLSEAIYPLSPTLTAKGDVIIKVKQDISHKKTPEVTLLLVALLQQIHLL